MTAAQRYEFNSHTGFRATDGRLYRREGKRFEFLCRRTGQWRLVRTATQPFLDYLAKHC